MGIIGGMGPMATVNFMKLVIDMTDAATDQEHIPMLTYNLPQIPDRTGYLLGSCKEDPGPVMAGCAETLVQAGAQVLAIPCFTAHAFFEQVQNRVQVPVIHVIRETADYLLEQGIHTVALEATDGTVQTGLVQRILEKQGIRVLLPSPAGQRKVMEVVYDNVKAGKPADMEKFMAVEQELLDKGAQVIIMGCTELSVVKRDHKLTSCYLDGLDVLARAAVKACGRLKPEFENLVNVRG